jgi:DNA-binding response OmpR family regulator
VDDDSEMVEAVQLMLQLLFMQSVSFSGARQAAQALLDGGKPDLILLDINMPEVSGLDLLEFVRRRSRWSSLPVVMLSTEAADVTVDQAMTLGADGYITKPVTLEELERALMTAIDKRKKGAS